MIGPTNPAAGGRTGRRFGRNNGALVMFQLP